MTASSHGDNEAMGSPVVFRLDSSCTRDDLSVGEYYHATVDGIVDYGMFVQLSTGVSGLVHESNYSESYEEGEEVIVELTAIKENGDLGFVPVSVDEHETELVTRDAQSSVIRDLEEVTGEARRIDGEVVQIKQTGGPTLFHVSDGTGVVPCAAFEDAGVRAYPSISIGDFVRVIGTVSEHQEAVQVEVDGIEVLEGEDAVVAEEKREEALLNQSSPAEIDPLIEWPALAKLMPGLERVASRLQRAVMGNRPVLIRHHADTDGMCASIPLEVALERFIQETHFDPEAPVHLLHRKPSRAPYYELGDVTVDLSNALEGENRHGQRKPVLVLIDNGSTTDDIPAYKQLESYGIPVIVIDHHHPDEEVESYLAEHVNPYLHDEDYRVTTGMMCVELARMISADVTEEVVHVPSVAGIADRSAADAMTEYLALAAEKGYERSALEQTSDALDYAAYQLRYGSGKGLARDILNVGGDSDRHSSVVRVLAERATREISRQLDDAIPHVSAESLGNGVELYRVDVEKHAHRFAYPAPGTTTGAIHDTMVQENAGPSITIGYGPDFAVLRSDGVRLDIPEIVSKLNSELAGAGVSGGGHLVVGSIQFVKGMREAVLDALVAEMEEAEIDESLGVTAPRSY